MSLSAQCPENEKTSVNMLTHGGLDRSMVPITDDTFKYICLNENDRILTRTLLKFVTTTRVQIMISQHFSRQWHGTAEATCHCLNRRCPRMTDACMRRSVEDVITVELMTYVHKYVATMVQRNID